MRPQRYDREVAREPSVACELAILNQPSTEAQPYGALLSSKLTFEASQHVDALLLGLTAWTCATVGRQADVNTHAAATQAADAQDIPQDGGYRASIIIPTYNRRATLERVLRALAVQTVPADCFEVLVVADGCTDGTPDLCRQLASELPYTLRLIEQANAGPAAARDRAVRAASAALILFVDDDVVPDTTLVATHLAIHQVDGDANGAHDPIVAMGPLLPPPDVRLNAWGAWEERTLCSHYSDMQAGRWQPSYRQFYTGNASVTKQRILDAGGFNAHYRRAEDIELALRLRAQGCTFAFLPEARGWHYVHRSFASWSQMPIAYGQATVAMGRAHGEKEVARLATEYYARNVGVRLLTRACIGSAPRIAIATAVLGVVARIAWALYIAPIAYLACSLIYNLRYYAGMAAELGGSEAFWKLIRAARAVDDWKSDAFVALVRVAIELLGTETHIHTHAHEAALTDRAAEVGAGG